MYPIQVSLESLEFFHAIEALENKFMLTEIKVVPHGYPCALAECPAGPFLHNEIMGFVVQSSEGKFAWYNENGEPIPQDKGDMIVTPCVFEYQFGSFIRVKGKGSDMASISGDDENAQATKYQVIPEDAGSNPA